MLTDVEFQAETRIFYVYLVFLLVGPTREKKKKKKLTSLCLFSFKIIAFLCFQAEACKSIEYAMKKCPNGMYSEIKYDGERVQVHKSGNTFSYFSRSLKPVLPHKVSLGPARSPTQAHGLTTPEIRADECDGPYQS